MDFNDFMSLIFIGLLSTMLFMMFFQGFFRIFEFTYLDDVRVKINFKNDN